MNVPPIITEDNHEHSLPLSTHQPALPALRTIAGQSIAKLQEHNSNLLVFPHPIHDYEDKIGEQKICHLNEPSTETATLQTHNIAGFIGIPAPTATDSPVNLRIHSRFDTQEQQYFFQYMLQRVFCPTLTHDISYNLDTPLPMLLAILFPYYLQKAMRQGIYKEYRHQQYNDARIKGTIDVSRHIKLNVPFTGKIAYHTREHSHNNRITQLVRHTIEYLRARGWLFDRSSTGQSNIREMRSATPDYAPQQRMRVIKDSMRAVRHPFFTDYEPLRTICLQILRHAGVTLPQSSTEHTIHGVIFDCAYLWEEYLNTILRKRKHDYVHPQNKSGTGKVRIYCQEPSSDTRSCYPDFYLRTNTTPTEASVVLDAKYKHLENSTIDRGDLYQMISYIHILKAEHGALIFPCKEGECKNHKSLLGTLAGHGGTLHTIAVGIPDNTDIQRYTAFAEQMKKAEDKFIDKIRTEHLLKN